MSQASRLNAAYKAVYLDNIIDMYVAKNKLDSWSAFVKDCAVPADLYPALATARPELIALAGARDMTALEVATLYKLIASLMETNMVLKEHAEQLSIMVKNWLGAFKHLHGVGDKINRFANFEKLAPPEDED